MIESILNKEGEKIELDLSKTLSDIVLFMKYSRYEPSLKRRETWEELVARNKQMHIDKYPFMKQYIDEAYDLVLNKKVLPSMRSMQFAGKPILTNNARAYNCSGIHANHYKVFSETMFLLLSGCGVGYSVQKHHVDQLPAILKPNYENKYPIKRRFLVSDDIEGWADAIKKLMKSYFFGTNQIEFDYRGIREKGMRLITSGGKAPGHEPLKVCIEKIRAVLESKEIGSKLKPIEVHDILCHIANAVLAGGIRRSAMISLFSPDDTEMLNCKSGTWWIDNEQRGRANNSAVLLRGKVNNHQFKELWKAIEQSGCGEPGIYWTNDIESLTNPCVEISLRTFCNLTEINADNIESQEDFNKRARAAAIIGTLQASYTDFHYLRDHWVQYTQEDALLGIGMTGIASNAIFNYDIAEAANEAVKTNQEIAKLLNILPAKRICCVKPSGTTSLVLGCASGIHAWYDEYYIRRMRIGKNESIYPYLLETVPELLEDCVHNPSATAIIAVPQKAPEGASLRNKESALELLERVKKIHLEWIKNGHIEGINTHNASVTVYVKNDEWETVGKWLWDNKDHYAGISILPYDGGTYLQTPFETITKEEYYELISYIKEIDLTNVIEENDNTSLNEIVACAGGACEIN